MPGALVWCISLSEFSICTFTAFLWLARESLSFAKTVVVCLLSWSRNVGVSSPCLMWDFEEDKRYSGFAWFWFWYGLDIMAHCHNRHVNWPGCTLSWFPHYIGMSEVSEVPSLSAFSTCHYNAHCEPMSDSILLACLFHFVPGDLTLVPAFQKHAYTWFSAYYPSEVPGSKGALRLLRFVVLTHMPLTLKVRGTGIFYTWLVIQTCVIPPLEMMVMINSKRCARLLASFSRRLLSILFV